MFLGLHYLAWAIIALYILEAGIHSSARTAVFMSEAQFHLKGISGFFSVERIVKNLES